MFIEFLKSEFLNFLKKEQNKDFCKKKLVNTLNKNSNKMSTKNNKVIQFIAFFNYKCALDKELLNVTTIEMATDLCQ